MKDMKNHCPYYNSDCPKCFKKKWVDEWVMFAAMVAALAAPIGLFAVVMAAIMIIKEFLK